MKKVRISNDSLNSYGFRVLTDGLDTTQYEKNPVLLYMHERGSVIGYMKDVAKVTVRDEYGQPLSSELIGEPVFDEASELSQRCKKQWEFGSLRMVSACLEPVETSESPDVLVEGQTRPTVTKSKLIEVSVVDIGANDDATVLERDGSRVELSFIGAGINNKIGIMGTIETKKLALGLGLSETSDEGVVMEKLAELRRSADKVASLEAEVGQLKLSAVTGVVDTAIRENRLDASKRDAYIDLGKEIGSDRLGKVLGDMRPRVKLGDMLGLGVHGDSQWKKLSDVPSNELLRLRSEQPAEYRRLYKAEYGMELDEA